MSVISVYVCVSLCIHTRYFAGHAVLAPRNLDQAITCASVGIRVALEQENKELRRLAAACDKRIIELEVCTCMCAISPSVRPALPPSSIYTYMTRSYMT